MAKDIGSGALKWSGHYLVDPWNCDGVVKLEKYPRLNAYYEKHSTALKKRHTAQKSTHAWDKTIDRVTHALTQKPKLYIADIRNILEPVLDHGETYPHHNLYFIQSEERDLEILGGLLISAIGQFFVESYGVKMRGGYLRFQAQYLRRIRVPSWCQPKMAIRDGDIHIAWHHIDAIRLDFHCIDRFQHRYFGRLRKQLGQNASTLRVEVLNQHECHGDIGGKSTQNRRKSFQTAC
jgi:TaqI-like C-terminal specificity domain